MMEINKKTLDTVILWAAIVGAFVLSSSIIAADIVNLKTSTVWLAKAVALILGATAYITSYVKKPLFDPSLNKVFVGVNVVSVIEYVKQAFDLAA